MLVLEILQDTSPFHYLCHCATVIMRVVVVTGL